MELSILLPKIHQYLQILEIFFALSKHAMLRRLSIQLIFIILIRCGETFVESLYVEYDFNDRNKERDW